MKTTAYTIALSLIAINALIFIGWLFVVYVLWGGEVMNSLILLTTVSVVGELITFYNKRYKTSIALTLTSIGLMLFPIIAIIAYVGP